MRAEGDFRARKSLGQNFLIHEGVVNRIVAAAALQPGEPVLEIGPGRGALTRLLARSAERVVAVEKDPWLVGYLGGKLGAWGLRHVRLVQADILRWDFGELDAGRGPRFVVLGNIPYNISSPLIETLLRNRGLFSRAILMLQQEMAARLTAAPGGKTYGAMTVLVRYATSVTHVMEVSREAFRPRPKVDSTVVRFDFEAAYPRRARDEAVFRRVVKGAFGHRRKTLMNALLRMPDPWPGEALEAAFERCGIDARRRAETLGMEDFLCLGDALALTNSNTGDT
ncbi:16S rRNA (adenine(1518)-N(6)/adenine(1519)-N(6))-dimethyltransferase RsmA [Desulfatiglans anilini]|uniref:16S rRNA (adenine(1518)-N(6)/adenine(1519)-N(6))- dimethyltransferase RsmA n=1 Tax=Desulfatiglans anilini TaxID=90728 RepID=UPI000418414D|nr:16S rRNA (adenine(1518)-N(6)/adenine(1519)-N(6))-dimethyltransferase RsmA [Desulfatiglans anilini]